MAFLTASPNFLFKTDQGEIDAPTWRRGAAVLLAILVVATILWRLLAPYARHDLDTMPFLQPMVMIAYTYLIVYSFAVILTAVCYVNLTAKRLRARHRPPGLAGLLPLLMLLAGAAHWLQPRMGDEMPAGAPFVFDAFALAVLVWIVVDCGILGDVRVSRASD